LFIGLVLLRSELIKKINKKSFLHGKFIKFFCLNKLI